MGESQQVNGEKPRQSLEMTIRSADTRQYHEGDKLEAQPNAGPRDGNEYSVSFGRKTTYLSLYFLFNLTVTLLSKRILHKVQTPWLLTMLHATATWAGTGTLVITGHLRLSNLRTKEILILLAFSSLFTLNIAVSNISLALVSVSFHQTARAMCPVVTALIYWIVYGRSYERQTYFSIILLTIGVTLASISDYYVTAVGATVTFLGVFLASTKTVTTNRLMTGSLAMSPLELLFRMSPLAITQCAIFAIASDEMTTVWKALDEGSFTPDVLIALPVNALSAFLLNVVSFVSNKLAGGLAMSVCGNLKQCVTIVLGVVLFDTGLTLLNSIGMAMTMAGAVWYSQVELYGMK